MKNKWWKDAEMITALSAMLIGVAALVIGAYQAKVASDQKAASVWPYVQVSRYNIQSEKFGFRITNKGVGPAIVEAMDVTVNGKNYKTWNEAFNAMTGEENVTPAIYSSTNKAVLAVNEKVNMIDVQGQAAIEKLQAVDDTIEIKVCYCSIFAECWLTGRGIDTQAVSSCKSQLEDSFIQ